jgi:hypothetical protein
MTQMFGNHYRLKTKNVIAQCQKGRKTHATGNFTFTLNNSKDE